MNEKLRRIEAADAPMIFGISAVRIFVSDLHLALDFYTGLLELQVSESADSSWALFRFSNVMLLVESVDPESSEFGELVGRFTGVSFSTPDIHETFERLTALGVRFEGPPGKQHLGGWLAHFHDSDSNILTLVG